jgi:hypothetical protein
MAQFYVARFRDDPIVMGVPFQLGEGQELVAAAVVALTIHAEDRALDKPWEIRIAGPFPIGPERIELINPKDHLS